MIDKTIIQVNELRKIYKIHMRPPGLISAVKDLVARKYEDLIAVDNLNLNVKEGEIIGYIGPNGAGKTTTLKILSGILHPTSGSVQVLGFEPCKRHKEFLKSIAFVMGQKSQLWWDIPPVETFLLNKEIYKIPSSLFNSRLAELTRLLNVEKLINIPVRKLSLGERMKMELISNLLHAPKLLFLDEPTIGLDITSQDAIRRFLVEYNRRYSATILLTSHYIKDIETICNRIIIINKGKIIFDGPKDKILDTLLKERLIKVRFRSFPLGIEKFGDVNNLNDRECIIKIPNEKVREALAYLSQKNEIEEVIVDNLQLEDVIREVFRSVSLHKNC